MQGWKRSFSVIALAYLAPFGQVTPSDISHPRGAVTLCTSDRTSARPGRADEPPLPVRPLSSLRATLVVALCLFALANSADAASKDSASKPTGLAADLSAELTELQKLRMSMQGLVAPLAPIALSPSLGVASLMGVGLLCETSIAGSSDQRWITSICDAPLVSRLRAHVSVSLFAAVSLFALACFFANSGKLQGVIGKVLKLIEAVPTVFMYFLIALATLTDVAAQQATGSTAPVMMVAGFSPSIALLLALMLTTCLVILISVRFALDLLIWLSPFPFVDLVAEITKNALAIALFALFLWSPYVATLVAIVLLLISVSVMRRSMRMVNFVAKMVLEPLLARLLSLQPADLDAYAVRLGIVPKPTLALEAIALAVPGFACRASGAIVKTTEGVSFHSSRWLRGPKITPLIRADGHLEIVRCVLWYELRVIQNGSAIVRVAIALSLASQISSLCRELPARYAGEAGASKALKRLFGISATPPDLAYGGDGS